MADTQNIILKARIKGVEQKIPITVSTDAVYLVEDKDVTLTQKLTDIIQDLGAKVSTEDLQKAIENLEVTVPIANSNMVGGIISVENEIVDGMNTYYISVEPDGKAKVSIPKYNITAEEILDLLANEGDIILNGGSSIKN